MEGSSSFHVINDNPAKLTELRSIDQTTHNELNVPYNNFHRTSLLPSISAYNNQSILTGSIYNPILQTNHDHRHPQNISHTSSSEGHLHIISPNGDRNYSSNYAEFMEFLQFKHNSNISHAQFQPPNHASEPVISINQRQLPNEMHSARYDPQNVFEKDSETRNSSSTSNLNLPETTDSMSNNYVFKDFYDGFYKDKEENYIFQILNRTAQGRVILASYKKYYEKIQITRLLNRKDSSAERDGSIEESDVTVDEETPSQNQKEEEQEEEQEDDDETCEEVDEILSGDEHSEKLINFNKHDMCSLLIYNEIDRTGLYDIDSTRFEFLASAIEDLLPTETHSTYYRYIKRNVLDNLYAGSRGTLYNRYRKIRAKHIELGLLQVHCRVPRAILKEGDEKQKLILLSQAKSDEEYKKIWRNILPELKLTFKINCVQTIFEVVPLLDSDLGITVMKEDFDNSFQDKSRHFLEKWPSISARLIEISKSVKRSNHLVNKILSRNTINTEAHQQNVALLLLSALLGPVTLGSSKSEQKPKFNLTAEDVLDTFILIGETDLDVKSKEKKVLDNFIKHKSSLQFYITVQGTICNPVKCNICIGDKKYTIPSLLLAVDTLFKIVITLQKPFPSSSNLIWLFLKRHIYELTSTDAYNKINKLISKIQLVPPRRVTKSAVKQIDKSSSNQKKRSSLDSTRNSKKNKADERDI